MVVVVALYMDRHVYLLQHNLSRDICSSFGYNIRFPSRARFLHNLLICIEKADLTLLTRRRDNSLFKFLIKIWHAYMMSTIYYQRYLVKIWYFRHCSSLFSAHFSCDTKWVILSRFLLLRFEIMVPPCVIITILLPT